MTQHISDFKYIQNFRMISIFWSNVRRHQFAGCPPQLLNDATYAKNSRLAVRTRDCSA